MVTHRHDRTRRRRALAVPADRGRPSRGHPSRRAGAGGQAAVRDGTDRPLPRHQDGRSASDRRTARGGLGGSRARTRRLRPPRPPVRRLASDRFARRHRDAGKAAFLAEALGSVDVQGCRVFGRSPGRSANLLEAGRLTVALRQLKLMQKPNETDEDHERKGADAQHPRDPECTSAPERRDDGKGDPGRSEKHPCRRQLGRPG
jgi:hypothetical protein